MSKRFTYVIGDGICVKVGRTDDVDARLRGLQCANPRELSVLSVLDGDHETDAHYFLRQQQIRQACGEWFEDSPRTRRVLRLFGFAVADFVESQKLFVRNEAEIDAAYRRGIDIGWERAACHYSEVFREEIRGSK